MESKEKEIQQLSETNDLFISLVSLSFVLAPIEILATLRSLVCVIFKHCFCTSFSLLNVKLTPFTCGSYQGLHYMCSVCSAAITIKSLDLLFVR